MPICEKCGNSVTSTDLKTIDGITLCSECLRLKAIPGTRLERKNLMVISLDEVPSRDGVVDHEISISGRYGGLDVSFKTTFDTVRAFFTERRERGKKAKLLKGT